MSERFLPGINQLKKAAEELPDPEIWPEEEYVAPVESRSKVYSITFRRIKFNSRKKGKTYRWIYEGKVLFRQKSLDED